MEALLNAEARPFLDRHLKTLERRRLIERIDPGAFRFAHPLIQMATYQGMIRDDRETLQQALTAQLDRMRAGSPNPVAQ
ncbi:MAG: hypothetical protein ABR505_09010 [Actinomycetota bacterium]